MKNTKKRGFTIVELVIVIAVIAILAAVLIPTFSNVISKANESNALQAARSGWTAYSAEYPTIFSGKDGWVKYQKESGSTTYWFEVSEGQFKATTDTAKPTVETPDGYTAYTDSGNILPSGVTVYTKDHTT